MYPAFPICILSVRKRAQQFMPFDALKGLRTALTEKERIIVEKKELSEERKEELDRKLKRIVKRDIITVEYFENGEYVRVTGMVSGLDLSGRVLKIVNQKISFDVISDLQGEKLDRFL